MTKLSKLAVLLILVIPFERTSFAESVEDNLLAIERESLRKAYKYEQEVKSYDTRLFKHRQEMRKLSEDAQKVVQIHKDEACQLKRKSFEQLTEYTKNDELFAGGEGLTSTAHRKFVFISLAQNKSNLEQIVKLAKVNGFIPVVRGFKDESYIETTKFLAEIIAKTGHGVVVDPESFKEFDVQVVPTFVVASAKVECDERQSCAPSKFNKIAGNIGFDYVMRLFESSGDKL